MPLPMVRDGGKLCVQIQERVLAKGMKSSTVVEVSFNVLPRGLMRSGIENGIVPEPEQRLYRRTIDSL